MTYEEIANTPWWIFVGIIYFLFVAYAATKPRIIPINRLRIFPILLTVFSILAMLSFHFNAFSFLIWLSGISLGIVLGWLQFKISNIKVNATERKLYVPGTYTVILIISLIFILKYHFNFQYDLSISLLNNHDFLIFLFLSYGLALGFCLGRLFYSERALRHGPFFDLPVNPKS